MNENKTLKGFWDIADKIEDAYIELSNVGHMINLLDESLERDVSILTCGDERAKWFASRYEMHQALLIAISDMFKRANYRLYELADILRAEHEPEDTE